MLWVCAGSNGADCSTDRQQKRESTKEKMVAWNGLWPAVDYQVVLWVI